MTTTQTILESVRQTIAEFTPEERAIFLAEGAEPFRAGIEYIYAWFEGFGLPPIEEVIAVLEAERAKLLASQT